MNPMRKHVREALLWWIPSRAPLRTLKDSHCSCSKLYTAAHPSLRFSVQGFSYPLSTRVQKQMILPLAYGQKVSDSLTLHLRALCPSPHFLSSRRPGTTSHHHRKKGEYSTVRYFEK